MHGEILHQFMVIITIGEARIDSPKLVPRIHLDGHKSDSGPVTNTVEANLPSAYRDILKAVLQ